jgi:two-component system nitrogen regulation response regulator GlnG
MSAAAMSCESISPVLPFVRQAAAKRQGAVGRRAGALGPAPHPLRREPTRLLVLDDDPAALAEHVRRAFPAPGYRVRVADSAACGLRHVRAESPDVVVLNLDLPDQPGLEVYRQIRQIDARVPVVFVTGARRPDRAIEAMKHGAYDVLFKPVELPALRRVVGEAADIARRMGEPAVPADAGTDPDAEGALVGYCPAMEEVYKAIGRVAAQDVPVLITGESGTGKELVARALYQHGRRAEAPFLALNCAAIPENLLESELFGHEKGAFTGADRRRVGKFEQANGGTLFLDEVGDMTLGSQAKVLRLLQEQSFERVGGSETIRTDVRIIAATNRDLRTCSAEGKFRADLYYRLGVFTIHLPPLRDRGDDLPVLVRHYVRRFSHELGREVREVAPEALERLAAYPWPGNVRELQSVLKQALLRASGPTLLATFLPELPHGPADAAPAPPVGDGPAVEALVIRQRVGSDMRELYADAHRQLDRLLLPRVLEHTAGSQHQAALLLGIARQTLRLKLRDLGLLTPRSSGTEKDEPALGAVGGG